MAAGLGAPLEISRKGNKLVSISWGGRVQDCVNGAAQIKEHPTLLLFPLFLIQNSLQVACTVARTSKFMLVLTNVPIFGHFFVGSIRLWNVEFLGKRFSVSEFPGSDRDNLRCMCRGESLGLIAGAGTQSITTTRAPEVTLTRCSSVGRPWIAFTKSLLISPALTIPHRVGPAAIFPRSLLSRKEHLCVQGGR